MDVIQFQNGMTIQLFIQPSLTSTYIRNNRSMSSYDFVLSFPAIPLSFGLSSDLASGWSKLVYEQSLLMQKQGSTQKIEVEILGLGSGEAHVVEECVKLLFGFKILVSNADVWLFLKVSDMLGLTQSPLCPQETLTIQETLLIYARDNLKDINLVEAWDYDLSILESGAESITIHKAEIRGLALDLFERAKDILKQTKFEILAQYAQEQDHLIKQSTPLQPQQIRSAKFTLRDLKREHYIQLRSYFYNHINHEQKTNLTQTQNVVKVLFDELDTHFELDGYINKYIDNISNKIEDLNCKIMDQQQLYLDELNQAKEKALSENKFLKEKQQELKRDLNFYKHKLEGMLGIQVRCSIANEGQTLLGMSNGLVEVVKEVGQNFILNTEINFECEVVSLLAIKGWIFVGLNTGQIYQFEGKTKVGTFQKQNQFCSVNLLVNIKQKLVLAAYQDGSLLIWDLQQQIIFDSTQKIDGKLAPLSVIYQHSNFGEFLVMGDIEGTIRFDFFNEAREKATLDQVKKMKNTQASITAISCLANYIDIILTAQKDKTVSVWNWESESLLTIIKLENICLSLQTNCLNDLRYLVTLLDNGAVQLYTFDQQRAAKFVLQVHVCQKPLMMFQRGDSVQYKVITTTGLQASVRIKEDPLTLNVITQPQLVLQSTLTLHTSCVYALTHIAYPLFASSSDDRLIKIFNINTQEVTQTFKGHQAYVRSIALLQDAKHLVSGSYDSSVKIWELSTGTCQNTLTGHSKPVLVVQVIYHTEYICISGGEDAIVKAWNWKQAVCIWMIEMGKNEVWSLQNVKDVASQTYGLLSGHKDGFVKFINIGYKGEQSVQEKELRAHKSFVNNILNIQDQIVACGSSDNLITILNWKQGIVIRTLRGHHDIVWHIDIVDDDKLISSSTEGTIKLWNWKTGACLNTAYCLKGSIYTLLKIQNSSKVLCGTATGDVLIWKIIQPQNMQFSKLIQL